MNKISEFLVRHRRVILIVSLAALVLGIVGTVFVVVDGKINSDLLVYLPKGTATSDGIEFLKENFDVEGDAFVVVDGRESDPELAEAAEKIKNIEGVTTFFWYGDLATVDAMSRIPGIGDKIDDTELKGYLKREALDENGENIYYDDGEKMYNYVFLVLFEYSPSTEEAFHVHELIRQELGENLNRSVAISGMTALANTVMDKTMEEIPLYLIFGILAVLIVLFIATDSFFDPIILMITLGIAVAVNMGTNWFFPEVSIISFAASGVLQLGITMDYAIFMLHAYKEERRNFSPTEASARAIPRTVVNLLCSSLTTIGGFAALYFMRFTIGADLANVIIKGVALSCITVVILQPCLLVYFDKAVKLTSHRPLRLNFQPVAKGTIKLRYVIAALTLLLVVPAFIGQHNVGFSYLKVYDEPEHMSSQERLATELQNQVILAVPLDTKIGNHKEFAEELLSDEKIDSVIGVFSIVDMTEEEIKALMPILDNPGSPASMLFSTVKEGENDRIYTLYLLGITGDTEDSAAFRTQDHIFATLDRYFDKSYPLGVMTGVSDMASVTPTDFLRVTLISAAIIFLVMSILLKSPLKSLLTVLLIELAIWSNISLNTLFGDKLNFMVYVVISSIQLGCTVDYAILLITRFEESKRKRESAKEAIIEATCSSFPAISSSAAIIIAVCLAIILVSDNLLVREMVELMARGAAISYLMVLFVLPTLLVFFKKRGGMGSRKKRKKVTENQDTETEKVYKEENETENAGMETAEVKASSTGGRG